MSSSGSELLLKLAAGCSIRMPKDSAGHQRPSDYDKGAIGATLNGFYMRITTIIGQPRSHRKHRCNVQKLLIKTDQFGGPPEVGRSCSVVLRSNNSMEVNLSLHHRYHYLLSLLLLFMFMFIVETSNGLSVPMNASYFGAPSSLAAIARKLRILNNQHAPPPLLKITNNSSNRRQQQQLNSKNKQLDEILTPSPSQIIPYSTSTGNQSTSSGHELRETNYFEHPLAHLPQAVPEVDIQAASSKSQRENDRRLQGNRLITSESHSIPWSITATTQFDDDDDDLYESSGRIAPIPATIIKLPSKTRSSSSSGGGQVIDNTPHRTTPTGPHHHLPSHQAQSSDFAKGYKFKLGHKVAATSRRNPSRRKLPASVGPIKSGNNNNYGEDNPTALKSTSQETVGLAAGLKVATNRRSVGDKPLADGSPIARDGIEPIQSNSSLKHLTLASEYSLLPLQDPTDVVANLPQPEMMVVNYDDQVAADDNNDLSQPEDRNASSSLSSSMKTTMVRLHNSSNNNSSIKNTSKLTTNEKGSSKLDGFEQQPTTISSYSENKLNKKHTITPNNTTIAAPSKTHQNLDNNDQLSSLLLNSDVRVTSELLVLNRTSPIEGLVVKNLTGRAELRHPHSFIEKTQALDGNDDNDNNHGKPKVWAMGEGLSYEEPMGSNSLGSERRFPPTHHLLNIIEEDSAAATTHTAAAGGDDDNYNADGSSLKLNWRGPIDTNNDDESLLPTDVAGRGPNLEERTFYGPFSSGTHHRLSLGGNGLQDPSSPSSSLGMNVKRQGSSPIEFAQGQANLLSTRQPSQTLNKTSNRTHSEVIVTTGNGSIPNSSSNSSSGSIRLKAAASMTGIRVIADPKLASKLVINSRGLITAPKKRTSSSSASNHSIVVTASGREKIKSSGGGGGSGKGKGGGERRTNPMRIINSNSTKKNHHSPTTNNTKGNSSISSSAKDNQIQLDLVSGSGRPEWLMKPPSTSPSIVTKQMPSIVAQTTDKIWRKNSSTNNRFSGNHVHQPTYDLMFEDGYSPGGGGGGGYFESGNLDSGGPLFSFEKGQKMNLSIVSNAHRHASSSSSSSLPNRIIFHDISVMDEDDNFIELPDHTHDYHNHPDAPIKTTTSGFSNLDWLNGDNSTSASSNNLNSSKVMSNYFTHNPPYKHHLLPLASQAAASQQENRTKLSSSYLRPDDDHDLLPFNNTTKYQIIHNQRHYQQTPQAFPTTGTFQDRIKSAQSNSSEITYLNSSPLPIINATTTPPYESSAAMISVNSSTISPQLNALDTNHPPSSPSQQQATGQTTTTTTTSTTPSTSSNHHGSGGSSGSKPTNKFKNKLQHLIIGKILKNTYSLANYTSASSPQPQWSTFPVSTLSPSAPQATTSSMITPPPLLSTTVANNVASMLAQKLNFLVKPSFTSPFSLGGGGSSSSSYGPQISQTSHGSNSGSGLGLGSLFGIRVGSGGGGAAGQPPAANQPGGSNMVANKLKQRINPFVVPTHSSVNRRTAGMGSLLISGFIYGLSVLPALMALTGINPLNPSGDDQTTSSTTRNSSPNRNSQHHKRSKAHHQSGRRLPPLLTAAASPVATSYATGPYAYLVPMISTVAADVSPPSMEAGEPTSQQSAPSSPLAAGQHHDIGGHAQQTAIKSLYAPPPTIIEPPQVIAAAAAAAETPTHQSIMDEFGSYDVNSLRNHRQFKQHLPYQHRMYHHQQSSHPSMQAPSSLQLASSMRLINEQLNPYPTDRYKATMVGGGGSHLLRYSQPMSAGSSASVTNEWPPPSPTPFDQRADEFGDDEIISGDEDNTHYANLWHSNRNPEDGNKNHHHYRHYKGNRGFEMVDPITAGDSQHHLTIDRAFKKMSSGSSMAPAKNHQNYHHRQVVHKLNYNPIKVQKAPEKQNHNSSNHNTINNINFKRVKGFPNQGPLGNQVDLWRAIPAPTIKGRVRKDNLNSKGGLNNLRRADGTRTNGFERN